MNRMALTDASANIIERNKNVFGDSTDETRKKVKNYSSDADGVQSCLLGEHYTSR